MATATTILEDAMQLTSEDRQQVYGSPADNFETTAALWDAYLDRRKASHACRSEDAFYITPRDVAMMMCLVKIARLANTPNHRDSLVDLAGYADCANRCPEVQS